MVTAKINPQERTLTILYPEFTNMDPVVIRVRSYEEAQTIVKIRQLKFIANELRSFINMRHYAYVKHNALTPERQRALKRLRFIVDNYSEGSLLSLAKRVAGSMLSFSVLMPKKDSAAKTHFDNHIVPILKYCIKLCQQ